MKIITLVVVAQVILIVTGDAVPEERKRMECYYMGITGNNSTLYPEDIDPSICTHLVYLHGAINEDTDEIVLTPLTPDFKSGGEGYVPRLAELKKANPDLKLLLHIAHPDYEWISNNSTRMSKIIQSAVKWLNESGFDGIDMAVYAYPFDKEGTADFFCKIKAEFDKYGYILTAIFMANSFQGPPASNVGIVRKIARCSDHVALRQTNTDAEKTHRIAPMSYIKSNVDKYLERGLPAHKILIIVPATGVFVRLENPRDNGMGAPVAGPGYEDPVLGAGTLIPPREILKMMSNSSLEWTIRRDKVTMEAYAFTTTGLWASYEDSTSMEYKARYVLEKGLGGVVVNLLESEDMGDAGNEGRFPLTSAVHRVFSRGHQSTDSNP